MRKSLMRKSLMRKHLMPSFVFIAVISAAPATALDLPARKAGLWEITMTMEGRNIPMPTAQHCIDAETDKLMSSIGGDMRKDMCSKQDVQKVGNTFVVDSVCNIGASTTTSQAVVSGDFNSAYTVKVTSKREGGPAMPGMPADGSSTMSIDAKWLGECKADQKPGDMIIAGRKINVRDLQNMMPAMPGGAGQKK
jgi:hypothetical protein